MNPNLAADLPGDFFTGTGLIEVGLLVVIGLILWLLFRLVVTRRLARSLEEVRQRTLELDTFFNAALDLLCIADTQGRFRRLNPEWEKTLGFTLAELEGHSFMDLVHPEDRQSTLAAVQELTRHKAVIGFTNRYRCKDGSYRWIEWRSYPFGGLIYAAARDITERKRAEAALCTSEANLQLALDSAGLGDWSWDVLSGEVVWSARCKALYGLPADTVMTYAKFLERVHPEDREWVDTALRQAVEKRSDYTVEKRIVWPDGSIHWTTTLGRVFCNTAGQPVRVAGITMDITERKEAEIALQESLSLLQATLESTADGILAVDHLGKVSSYNQQFIQLWHLSEETLARRDDQALLTQVTHQVKDPEAFLDKVRQIYAQPEMDTFDMVELIDGRVFERFSRPQWLNGRPVGRVWSFRDITKRKRAEEDLRKSMTRLQTVVTGAPIVLYSFDRDGVFTVSEGKGLWGLGLKPGQIVGHTIYEIYGDQPEAMAALKRALAGETFTVELSFPAGGTFEASHIAMRDEAGAYQGTIGVLVDVTERKRSEQALRASLDEKVALLKEVHHRVKNNLQIVTSLLSLQATQQQDQKVIEVLRNMQNRVRAMGLLHEMLYRSENLARIDFAGYMQNMCAHLLRAQGDEGGRVQMEYHLAAVDLNLEQAVPAALVIAELVSNALKHAFPQNRSGRITLSLSGPADGQVTLSVVDDGVGLPASLDIDRSSTLGLRLARILTTQLKGTLTVKQEAGCGFELKFPIH